MEPANQASPASQLEASRSGQLNSPQATHHNRIDSSIAGTQPVAQPAAAQPSATQSTAAQSPGAQASRRELA